MGFHWSHLMSFHVTFNVTDSAVSDKKELNGFIGHCILTNVACIKLIKETATSNYK